MTYFAERRKYQRCTNIVCRAMMCTENGKWREIELVDISAGGLKFISKVKYGLNTVLYFDLCLYNMLSEFKMKLEGHIIREEENKGTYLYSVKFINMNKYNQIQLDEIIKSRITVSNTTIHPVSEDGIYTFLFIPRARTRRTRMLR